MERVNIKTGQIHKCDKQFHSEMEINLQSTDTYEIYTEMKDTIKERITQFLRSGSNWKFRSIIRLEVHTVKYVPLKGSSYIPLPQELAKKKAIINLKNNDNQCFKWAVARALNPKQRDAQLIDKHLQEKAKELNWENIEFPVSLKAIDKFEQQNPKVNVNVLGYEGYIYILYKLVNVFTNPVPKQ